MERRRIKKRATATPFSILFITVTAAAAVVAAAEGGTAT